MSVAASENTKPQRTFGVRQYILKQRRAASVKRRVSEILSRDQCVEHIDGILERCAVHQMLSVYDYDDAPTPFGDLVFCFAAPQLMDYVMPMCWNEYVPSNKQNEPSIRRFIAMSDERARVLLDILSSRYGLQVLGDYQQRLFARGDAETKFHFKPNERTQDYLRFTHTAIVKLCRDLVESNTCELPFYTNANLELWQKFLPLLENNGFRCGPYDAMASTISVSLKPSPVQIPKPKMARFK